LRLTGGYVGCCLQFARKALNYLLLQDLLVIFDKYKYYWAMLETCIVSVIAGGRCNTVSGTYSAILGGFGNNDAGFNAAGIFGQNVTAVASNTFHVECLNAVNTPPVTGGPFPSGTYAWKAGNLIGAGDKVLVLL
jgi:hypothetical protein